VLLIFPQNAGPGTSWLSWDAPLPLGLKAGSGCLTKEPLLGADNQLSFGSLREMEGLRRAAATAQLNPELHPAQDLGIIVVESLGPFTRAALETHGTPNVCASCCGSARGDSPADSPVIAPPSR